MVSPSSRSMFSNSSSNEPDSKSSLPPSSANPTALESRMIYAVLYPYPLGCKLSSRIIETSAGVVEPWMLMMHQELTYLHQQNHSQILSGH